MSLRCEMLTGSSNEFDGGVGALQVRNWGKTCDTRVVVPCGALEAIGQPYAGAFTALYPRSKSPKGFALLPLAVVGEALKVLFESSGAAQWPPPCPAGALDIDPLDPAGGWLAWLNDPSDEHVLQNSALWRHPAWLQPTVAPAMPGGEDAQPMPA